MPLKKVHSHHQNDYLIGRRRRDPRRRHSGVRHRAVGRGGRPAARQRLQADRQRQRQPAQQGGAQRIPQGAGEYLIP